jgi:hypothetical protein
MSDLASAGRHKRPCRFWKGWSWSLMGPTKWLSTKRHHMKTRQGLLTSALLCLTFVATSHPGYGATVGFKLAVNYPVGTAPVAVASGDFNGDGKMDLAVANSGNAIGDDGNVSILLGNGDGTFQPANNNMVAGKNPSSIAVGDFNGDNRLDLIVANNGNNTVSVLLGNGDGTFQTHVDYATGTGPYSVALGDFNGDQSLDLAVAAHPPNVVSVLLGNGDGTFQTHVDYATGSAGGNAAVAVAAADFNQDRKADLAVPGSFNGGVVGILEGNGDGSLQPPLGYDPAGLFGEFVAVGDFNGDGKLDLVVTFAKFGNATTSGVGLLLGNGDGTFSGSSTALSVGCANRYPIVADFDGDSKLDFAVMGGGHSNEGVCVSQNLSVGVWAGNGDGTFQAPVSFTPANAFGLAAASDLDGNKSPDLVTVNSDNTVSVLLNTAGTDFSISASAASPSSVTRGQSSTSTITLSLLNAFDNPVSLACSVQPAQAGSPACSLSSNSVTFDSSGKATATLTITAGSGAAAFMVSPHAYHDNSHPFSVGWLPVAAFAFMGRGLGCGYSRRRRYLFFVGCVLAGLIFQAACGGGSSDPKSANYAITITGTSGSIQHSTTTTLTVQ